MFQLSCRYFPFLLMFLITISLNVSEVSAQSLYYLGCYKDNSDRDFDIAVGNGRETPASCVKKCLNKGYPLAAVQYYGQCFCGTRVGYYGFAKGSVCQQRCKADRRKICPGAWTNRVFFTGMGGYCGNYKVERKCIRYKKGRCRRYNKRILGIGKRRCVSWESVCAEYKKYPKCKFKVLHHHCPSSKPFPYAAGTRCCEKRPTTWKTYRKWGKNFLDYSYCPGRNLTYCRRRGRGDPADCGRTSVCPRSHPYPYRLGANCCKTPPRGYQRLSNIRGRSGNDYGICSRGHSVECRNGFCGKLPYRHFLTAISGDKNIYKLQVGVVSRRARPWYRLPSNRTFRALHASGGQLWGVDSRKGQIWRYPGNGNWSSYGGGNFIQVVGAPSWKGTIYALRRDGTIHRKSHGKGWWQLPSNQRFKHFSAVGGQVWGVTRSGVIQRYTGRAAWASYSKGGYTQVYGSAKWNGVIYALKNNMMYGRSPRGYWSRLLPGYIGYRDRGKLLQFSLWETKTSSVHEQRLWGLSTKKQMTLWIRSRTSRGKGQWRNWGGWRQRGSY